MLSCSHKKNALNFLDNFCSFYEQKYIFASSKAADNTQAFLDTVYELAEANGLPSNTFKSALTEVSIDQLRKHLNKVCYCCYLASRCFYSSVLATALFIYFWMYSFYLIIIGLLWVIANGCSRDDSIFHFFFLYSILNSLGCIH